MRIPAQIHTYEGARPRALPEGLGFPVEKIEDMSAGEAEEHIAALYGDELYGLELDGEVSGEGAMRCACSPVHDEVRGICDMLGLDFTRVDRIATGRAGMLWAGEGMPHRFDACWIGYIFLDDFGRTKPAFLNSTGVMYPSVECILKLLYQCT